MLRHRMSFTATCFHAQPGHALIARTVEQATLVGVHEREKSSAFRAAETVPTRYRGKVTSIMN